MSDYDDPGGILRADRDAEVDARNTRGRLIQELQSELCRCGASKQQMATFCHRCYYNLPKDLRDRLYRRVGNGYEEAYVESVAFLDVRKAAAEKRT